MNFGQDICAGHVEILVKRYDADNDGFLSFEECVALLSYIEH